MAERIKVFFASSSELKEEREKCIYITNKLRKAHEHLDIDPVLWEHDMTHSSFPGNSNIQDAITKSELKDSPVVVFLFHSKIGQYTREEFDYATKNNKKIFVYFKAGFSPEEENLQAYTELLQFKKSLNSTVLYDSFKDLADFENKMFANLNLFFSQQYRSSATQTALPSADIKNLMMQMMQEMKTQKNSTEESSIKQIADLQAEIKKMREQLFAKDEKAKVQHEKTKHELEQQLSGGKEGNELLIKALEEIEIGNYDKAEDYLLERVEELENAVSSNRDNNDIADDLADTYYRLGRTRELQFDYQEAFDYYTNAYQTVPEVPEYRFQMARMAVELEMWDEALEYYDEVLPAFIDTFGENSLEVADIYIGMAACFSAMDDEYDNVIEYTEDALKIMRMTGNEEDPVLIVAYDRLAFAYGMKENYTKAITFGKKAIALSIKLNGEDNSILPYYYQTLGDIYDSKGEYEKAVDLHSKAIDLYLRNYEEGDPGIELFYMSYGSACRGLGAYDEAIDSYSQALAIVKKHAADDGTPAEEIQQVIKEIKQEKKNAG